MTRDQATQLVIEHLTPYEESLGEKLVVLTKLTIEKSYGWILFYNTHRYIETGDFMYALGGNGPIVVERSTGRLTELGTARPIDEEIAAFERVRGLTP